VAATLLVAGASWGILASGAAVGESRADGTAQGAATAPQGAPSHALAGARDSYADIVAVVAPAVVTIRVEGQARVAPTAWQDDDLFRRFFPDRNDPFGLDRGEGPRSPRGFRPRGLGSGVIVTPDGYILTNHHVVDGAQKILVDFTDGRTFDGTLIGSDRPSDLAVIKIAATDLRPLALGNSDAVRVGDVVLAIGNPLGVGQTVTMGIVSAKGRSTGIGDGGYEDFLQTDAPINQGNSGGALVSMRGELVGINSQILSTSAGNIGIGFAIPANMARSVMDDLRTGGRVRRAQLGVTVQPVTSDLAASLGLKQTTGVLVSGVQAGSAAEKAGVKRGDVIRSFNGQDVTDANALRNRVAAAKPGSTARLIVVRDGSEHTLSATLDELAGAGRARNEADEEADDRAVLGVAVAPLTPELASRAGLPRDARGLLVREVDPNGRAAASGIQRGDIIQEVNRQPVRSVDELRAAVRETTERPALLLVSRDGRDLFLTVRPS
jgi:Do/DeqQ family serine protease